MNDFAVISWWWPDNFDWNWGDLWSSMGWHIRGIALLLAVMLACVLGIVTNRLVRFALARRQSRRFICDVNPCLKTGNVQEALRVAHRAQKSHVAAALEAGLGAFQAVPSHIPDSQAIEIAKHAFERKKKLVTAEMKLGVRTLSMIESTAPFLGLLATVLGIFNAFPGGSGPKSIWLAFIMHTIAESLAPAAVGICVAVAATWFAKYLNERVEVFDVELSNAGSELLTYLRAQPDLRNKDEVDNGITPECLPFGVEDARSTSSWEVPYDRQRLVLLSVGAFALYLLYLLGEILYWSVLTEYGMAFVPGTSFRR